MISIYNLESFGIRSHLYGFNIISVKRWKRRFPLQLKGMNTNSWYHLDYMLLVIFFLYKCVTWFTASQPEPKSAGLITPLPSIHTFINFTTEPDTMRSTKQQPNRTPVAIGITMIIITLIERDRGIFSSCNLPLSLHTAVIHNYLSASPVSCSRSEAAFQI